MKTFTEDARKHLDKYLQQIRIYLQGCQSVDADEVERDVMEHIEEALEGAEEPVSFNALDAVLKRLGHPSQWVPIEELPWWRRMTFRLRTGPEDWRLAYLSIGILVLGILFGRLFFLAILASFCVSRAALSMVEDPNELGAQKWLIYPSLILVYISLLLPGLVLFWCPYLLFRAKPKIIQNIFRPFADWFDRKWSRRIFYIGLGAAIIAFLVYILSGV